MELSTRFIFIFVLFFLILFTHNLFASDWEYWSNSLVFIKLREKVDFRIIPHARLKNKCRDFYYYKTYIGPTFKISKFFKISPLYMYKIEKKRGVWKEDNVGNMDMELKLPFLVNAYLDYRYRTEYNFTQNNCVHRNKFELSKDCEKINGLSLFLYDEIFYSFAANKLNENRVSASLSKKINDNLNLGLSYIVRFQDSTDWHNTNIVQTEVKVSF